MGTLLCGLCVSLAACSDDDDNVDDSKATGGTEMSTDVTDDETVLASILGSLCDFDPVQDLRHGIIDGTFEATEGDVVDPENSRVRTVLVTTLERADAYASSLLGALGCPASSPAGFRWQNDAIGSIRYDHGTGNELGVIELSVKQIPDLWKLRLVATPEINAGEDPYYSKGDIVQNKDDGKYYICVSNHEHGQKSTWISFDSNDADRSSQKTNTASWLLTGSDRYYSQQQANYSSLATWLSEYVVSDAGYSGVLNALAAVGLNADNITNQIVPGTQELRQRLIEGLTYTGQSAVFEAWKTIGRNETVPRMTRYDYQLLDSKKDKWETRVYKPTGLLLGYNMRWTMTFHYWQPYILLVREPDFTNFNGIINSVESQTTLSTGHFAWKELMDQSLFVTSTSMPNSGAINGRYHVCVAAIHWTHDTFNMEVDGKELKIYGLVDFVAGENKQLSQYDWMRHNITSREITYKDKGKKYFDFKSIRIDRHLDDRDF